MKKPLVIMLSIILTVAVLCALGVGTYLYLKRSAEQRRPHTLTAAQAQALQVALPQMTTNLETDGLIQFTMTLQASDKTTKDELNEMLPDVEDTINRVMLTFTAAQLKQVDGFDKLKTSIENQINRMLQHGSVTKVDLSQIVVQ